MRTPPASLGAVEATRYWSRVEVFGEFGDGEGLKEVVLLDWTRVARLRAASARPSRSAGARADWVVQVSARMMWEQMSEQAEKRWRASGGCESHGRMREWPRHLVPV